MSVQYSTDTLPFKFTTLPIITNPFEISSRFGFRSAPVHGASTNHRAVDVRAKFGTDILAVYPGKVIEAGFINSNCGVGVSIEHYTDASNPSTPTYVTSYCHMRPGSTDYFNIAKGVTVVGGQPVGRVGDSGNVSGPHLHFKLKQVRRLNRDIEINPEPFLLEVATRFRVPFISPTVNYNPPQEENIQFGSRNTNANISPFIHTLESFHPKIQYELTRRRIASETANTYMPFVRLTSLTKVLSDNLADGGEAYCPSLGIHSQDSEEFEDIYSIRTNRSTVGFAFSENETRRVRVLVKDGAQDPPNTPPPGITQVSVERGTVGPMGVRGGLVKANLKIIAYSVGQLDTLLRYFLRPATRAVLELGRQSSNQNADNEKITPYDWAGSNGLRGQSAVADYFKKFITNQDNTQQEFINKYVYGNNGNYEIFVMYVVKFNLKYTKNNTIEIDLTLHSVQQFEIPTKHTGVKSFCSVATSPCKVMDIQEYFSEASSKKVNSFNNLISNYSEDSEWMGHIVPIRNENPQQAAQGAGSTQGGTRENEYFITWEFFVKKLLTDKLYGIASIFGEDEKVDELIKLGFPKITDEPEVVQGTQQVIAQARTELVANEVGYHPSLRSTNPEIIIIYNPTAQDKFNATDRPLIQTIIPPEEQELLAKLNPVDVEQNLEARLKQFFEAQRTYFTNAAGPVSEAGVSYLTRGIWLNTKAIKQAFSSADTVTTALSTLLMYINSATEGYWNLQLYSTDNGSNPGIHIIDMGLSKAPLKVNENSNISSWIDKENEGTTDILDSIDGVKLDRYTTAGNKPRYIYMFNRKTKRLPDGELGSDIIDLNVEFNLPQVVAVQAIAGVGGPAQKSLLQSIDINELNKISLINNIFSDCNTENVCTEPNVCSTDDILSLEDKIKEIQLQLDPLTREGREGYGVTQLREQLQQAQQNRDRYVAQLENPNLLPAIRQLSDLGTAIYLVELNPSKMLKNLNIDSLNFEEGRKPPTEHAFNSSNLTKTVVDVTLPGIGGVSLWQSFLVDRVPSILERGFYVVTKITHEFTVQSGWITKLQGRFRFRPVPDPQKPISTRYDLCAEATQTTRPSNQPTQPQAIQPTIQTVPPIQAPSFFPQLPSTRPKQMEVFGDTAVTRSIPLRNP